MLFDFERFSISTKLAYRRCNGNAYTLDEVLSVFKYYFETYEMIFETAHPVISISQTARIIEKMPFLFEEGQDSISDITPDDYVNMIDQHFITQYRNCDYNVNHFFTGKIRNMRYYETCY